MAGKDYKNGKIYCIRNIIDDDIYVGSTIQKLSKRMAVHRMTAELSIKKHIALYAKMNDLGIDAFYIELIEECPCDNQEQLLRTEGSYIRQIGTLNTRVAGRNKKEYWDANKDSTALKKKETITCGCGSCCRYSDKARHERTNKHKQWLEKEQV